MKTYIFGAKATAAGLYKALEMLYPSKKIHGFLVSSREENPEVIWHCPVLLLSEVARDMSVPEKKDTEIYVAVPELIHESIKELLLDNGFSSLIFLNSHMEAEIMEKYFEGLGEFRSIHTLTLAQSKMVEQPKLEVYTAAFYKDKPLSHPPIYESYVKKIFLGCYGARKQGIEIDGKADFFDDIGDNISDKNPNRCEMTAHYWIWKNRMDTEDEYIGVCHYRRLLDMNTEDLLRLNEYDIDVVLPYPMVHYPNANIQHTWYVPEKDWETMCRVVKELYPDYAVKFDEIFGQPYFYNYNIMIAKKKVFEDYCAWLYPILDRIEEISKPKGCERADRYTAYMSESLTTLYFMYHKDDLNIYHTGRLLFI